MAFFRRDILDGYLDPGGQFLFCLFMDAAGMATYLIPIVGELGDIVFAPLEALWIWMMLSGTPGPGGAYSTFGFAEEIVPLATDWIPACTAAWIFKYYFRR